MSHAVEKKSFAGAQISSKKGKKQPHALISMDESRIEIYHVVKNEGKKLNFWCLESLKESNFSFSFAWFATMVQLEEGDNTNGEVTWQQKCHTLSFHTSGGIFFQNVTAFSSRKNTNLFLHMRGLIEEAKCQTAFRNLFFALYGEIATCNFRVRTTTKQRSERQR